MSVHTNICEYTCIYKANLEVEGEDDKGGEKGGPHKASVVEAKCLEK